MPSYSDEDYEQIARNLREELGIDSEIWVDVLNALRRMKYAGYLRDFVCLPDNEIPDAEAKFVAEERTIYFRQSVYDAAERDDPHARFTVVHEISHCALHHQHTRKRGIKVGAFEKGTFRRDETQADKLAAAFLAPFHRAAFNLDTTADQLARRFGVSSSVSKTRLSELGGIYRRLYNIVRELPAGVVDFLSAKRREGHVVRSLPPDDIMALRVLHPKYEGEVCPNPHCREFKMVRVGTYLKCDVCGARTGDE